VPTAQQSVTETHVTPWSGVPGYEGVSRVHTAPFHCSMKPPYVEAAVKYSPTAQHAEALAHATLSRPLVRSAGTGDAAVTHAFPFQLCMKDCSKPPPGGVSAPTAQHWVADTQATPSRYLAGLWSPPVVPAREPAASPRAAPATIATTTSNAANAKRFNTLSFQRGDLRPRPNRIRRTAPAKRGIGKEIAAVGFEPTTFGL
jgi:hypothetical protein